MKKKFILISKILFLFIVFCWIVIVFTDYFRVRQKKEPIFCISQKIYEYNDGSTHVCNGVFYKVVNYNRTCLSATEFGPFFIKERQCNS